MCRIVAEIAGNHVLLRLGRHEEVVHGVPARGAHALVGAFEGHHAVLEEKGHGLHELVLGIAGTRPLRREVDLGLRAHEHLGTQAVEEVLEAHELEHVVAVGGDAGIVRRVLINHEEDASALIGRQVLHAVFEEVKAVVLCAHALLLIHEPDATVAEAALVQAVDGHGHQLFAQVGWRIVGGALAVDKVEAAAAAEVGNHNRIAGEVSLGRGEIEALALLEACLELVELSGPARGSVFACGPVGIHLDDDVPASLVPLAAGQVDVCLINAAVAVVRPSAEVVADAWGLGIILARAVLTLGNDDARGVCCIGIGNREADAQATTSAQRPVSQRD